MGYGEAGSGAATREYVDRPTNVYLTPAQRAYVEARAKRDTEALRAQYPHQRPRVTISDVMRMALDQLIEAEPVEVT